MEQRQTKTWHMQGMLDETDPLIIVLFIPLIVDRLSKWVWRKMYTRGCPMAGRYTCNVRVERTRAMYSSVCQNNTFDKKQAQV